MTYRIRIKDGVPTSSMLTEREWSDEYSGTSEEIARCIEEDLHRYGLRLSDVTITPVADNEVVRVIVERAGRCVINSPIDPPATRMEIEAQQWAKHRGGFQSFQYDACGVVIISTL